MQEATATSEAPLANVDQRSSAGSTRPGDLTATPGDATPGSTPTSSKHPAVRVTPRAASPGTIVDVVRFRDETTIHVRASELRDVCASLRDDERTQLNFLTDLTAVDMLRLRTDPTLRRRRPALFAAEPRPAAAEGRLRRRRARALARSALERRELAGARGVRHVRHRLRGPPEPAPHAPADDWDEGSRCARTTPCAAGGVPRLQHRADRAALAHPLDGQRGQ